MQRSITVAAILAVISLTAFGCKSTEESSVDHGGTIIQESSITFEEVAPFVEMATVVGDKTTGSHGTFGIFKPNASSPPHTHSGAYHGVVISGVMANPFTNDEVETRLPAGSYWYVPAGQEHVTSCLSDEPCKFYFYADEAFDFAPQESLGNHRDRNARQLPNTEREFQEVAPFVDMAAAHGDRSAGSHGTFGLFKAGAASPKHVHTGAYHGVVLTGVMTNPFGDESNPPKMEAGSYWYVAAGAPHVTSCVSEQPCEFFFYADSAFDFALAE